MQIAEGIGGLQMVYHFKQREFYHMPALLWDEHDVVLCDTGMPALLPQLQAGMKELGIPFEKITKIIISHHDIDHIGNLRAIKDRLPQVKVYATAIEKPYIERKLPPIKPLELTIRNAPVEQYKDFDGPFDAPVDVIVKGGDVLPFCGGIEIIDTPGHSPGQISLLHKKSRTLITNDALCFMQGKVIAPFNSLDQNQVYASIRKLTGLDYDQVLFYHGGFQAGDIHQKIKDFVESLQEEARQ